MINSNYDGSVTIDNIIYPNIFWESSFDSLTVEYFNIIYEFTIHSRNYHILSHICIIFLNKIELKEFDEYWEPFYLQKDNFISIKCVSETSFNKEFPLEFDITPSGIMRI